MNDKPGVGRVLDFTMIGDAARLVYLGLKQTSPYASAEYKRFLRDYERDVEFQRAVDAIASGMRLKVLHVDENLGIVLCPESDSAFTYSVRDDNINLPKDLKSIWGLVLLSIAAYLYPKAESFNETGGDEVQTITPERLDAYIRERCEMVGKENIEDVPASEAAEKEIMFKRYLEHVPVIDGVERSRSTTTSAIKKVFKFLEGKKLVRERENGAFAILPTFKYLMRELSTNEHMQSFLERAARDGTGEHDPVDKDQ